LYHYDSSRTGEIDHGYQILGSFDDLFNHGVKGVNFALSMGDNYVRTQLFNKLLFYGGRIPTLIHPKSNISRFAKIGYGSVIHTNAIVEADVVIGSNTILSYDATMTHSSHIANNCFVAPKALVGAYVSIEDNVFIGLSATVVSGKVDKIGANSVIGAGAVVINSVPNDCIVAGVPAKIIKELPSPSELSGCATAHYAELHHLNRKEAA
jgi:UDP-perosamine 4-acetyltransferase